MNAFDKAIEIINWIKIALSPIIISLFLATIVFFYFENFWLKALAGLIVLTGLVVGIMLAEKIRKKHGTENFMAKVSASPDLDDIKK